MHSSESASMESESFPSSQLSSPAAFAMAAPSPVRLFTPPQVFVAAFLGSALGGLILIAYNFHITGQRIHRQRTIWIGAILVPLWLAFLILVPDTQWDRVWPLVTAVVMSVVAKAYQGKQVLQFEQRPGIKPHSMVVTLIVAATALVVQFFLVLPYFLYLRVGI